ncbi:uncharacterized protein EV154DRAFT_494571 [Mucor mucedo]|uniref:Transmembrane protein n=1 Tax=Mucor saturninus TaxID=64648 RepID=A0A8H7R3Q2_9FUNG|nr:uncharacterized protein EV154DRAFT_494571 [Mucor mucedo]KAG2203939.1 hypothetical protein INT47_007522 [Mucor saturninus]KAI7895674.1 hypothetical protein EV154DRAFT_494571 [Mucor mucedo]
MSRTSSLGSATSSTPLLNEAPKSRGVHRVPTFFKSSIPNRRSLLHAFVGMAIHMLFELVLPIILYYVLRGFVSPLLALLLAGLPTAVIVVYKGFKERKVDMMGVLMLMGFVVSAILAFVQSDPKLYLLRESAMTLAMGTMLIITLLPLRWRYHVLRPFMFYVARQIAISSNVLMNSNTVREHWDWFWDYYSTFRYFLRALTGVWGLGLVSEFLVRVVLINSLDDVDDVVYYSNIYMLIVMILLGSLTVISTLLLRHYFNMEQSRIKVAERRSEIENIIARAAAERKEQQKKKKPTRV